MSTSPETEPLDGIGLVAESFRSAMVKTLGEPPTPPNPVVDLLTEHLGVDPRTLEVVTDEYAQHLQLNLQAALDAFLGEEGREHRILGIHCPSGAFSPSLSLLMIDATLAWSPLVLTPARYVMIKSSSDDTMACLAQGLVLFSDDNGPGAIWFRGFGGFDVMHPDAEHAAAIVARIRQESVKLSPYRGQVVEIGFQYARRIEFLPRPEHTEADQVILPKGLLEEIEEHTLEVVKARRALGVSGRHMKRGILLHDRPGTGKTHTIRYLVSQMPDATVAVMSGRRMAGSPDMQPLDLIREVIEVITPGVIILDDVDFIAEDRTLPGQEGSRDSLFALLDLLDGIDDDSDLLFVLTTNRPNMLEPAVAARPGRIDQAIEVPLPDEDCRRRLLALYARGTDLQASPAELDRFIERTDGVTASFVREAVRRAAASYVLSDGIDQRGPVVIDGPGLEAALDELLSPDNPLTPVLLGAEPDYAKATLARIFAPAE